MKITVLFFIFIFEIFSLAGCDKTPDLLEAAKVGDMTRIHGLLEANNDVNEKNSQGETALMLAAKHGQVEAVNMLLNAKADVNAKSDDGKTALKQAAENGHFNVVKALLDANADVNAKASNGVTALILINGKSMGSNQWGQTRLI